MTDQPNTPEAGPKPTEAPKPDFQPITSQEQLNALLGDRLARERAKFADYDELKAKATKFDQAEQANKTELEKAVEANQQLRTELDALKAKQLRHDVAAAKGLHPDAAAHLVGATREELEASADSLATLIGAHKPQPPTLRLAGQQPNPDPQADARAFVDNLVERTRR